MNFVLYTQTWINQEWSWGLDRQHRQHQSPGVNLYDTCLSRCLGAIQHFNKLQVPGNNLTRVPGGFSLPNTLYKTYET